MNKSQEVNKIAKLLKKIVTDYGDLEIFSEENHSRLNKALTGIDDSLCPAKDWLLIANMKYIPQKLYSVIDSVQNERQDAVDECRDILSTLAIDEDVCRKIISFFMAVLKLDAAIEKRIIGVLNFAEHEYKTCQIGDKIWLAENLKNKSFCNHSIGKTAENINAGRCYTWDEAHLCDPSRWKGYQGWRLPTVEDYQDLMAYIESLNYEPGMALKSKNQWHGRADSGVDLFGFCAYPTIRVSETGTSQTWFWTSTETNDSARPHYCVGIDADGNDVIISGAGDAYRACVRFVKDVE